MRRGRTVLLLGLLLLGIFALLLVWFRSQAPPPKAGTPTAAAVSTTKIVVAIQPIQRGSQVITAAVALFDWPTSQLPPRAFTEVASATGRYAKMDIAQGLPILEGMLASNVTEATIAGGSNASLAIQPGKIAAAFPLRSTYPEKENLPYDRRDPAMLPRLLSVAYAVQPGDHVDILACFWVYDLDREFQTRLPNQIGYIDPQNPGKPVVGMPGRRTVVPGGGAGVEGPSEAQLPRMVCQWTVQNARVLQLGDWGGAQPKPTPAPGGGNTQATPAPTLPEVVTLEMDPQDALVTKYARETGAQMDLVLRAATDKDSKFTTEAVTLQYVFERFRVAVPPKLDYAIGGGGGVPVGAKPQ